ncbi:MAG: putative ABC transporter permease [Ruminococcus flavefaciens]|nr:putative ABC transporter permease [Ruminococcus flavefaciens]
MKAFKMAVLTFIGGLLYIIFEILFRGYTHWTMFIVGGICGYLVEELDDILPWNMPFVIQCVLGGLTITMVEFISGCIINIWLEWNVWDYSKLPFNLLGQVCLSFTALWILVCAIWIPLCDYINYALFNEEKPHYTILGE